MKEIGACAPGNLTLRTTSLPFSEIPEQTRLFLDYQQNPSSLSKFYPGGVASPAQVAGRIPGVLENYTIDREILCDALARINKTYDAGEKTFENIALLRKSDCVAVVTGQQAGLFTGPLYTIYKALSAVKLAECLRARGLPAVPVFWTASEDHDFDEVSNAFVLNRNNDLTEAQVEPADRAENLQVGFTALDSSIEETVDTLIAGIPETEFTSELSVLLRESWFVEEMYGDAFSKLLSRILRKFGLIIFDPLDKAFKGLAAPIYSKAIERSGEIVSALIERDKELARAGYHSQVLVTEDYFPLFVHGPDHTRHSLKKTADGMFKAKTANMELSIAELISMAANDPNRFSPTVVLRPVVQDYLLPTVCYFGGAAEIAYFAQNSEVYRVMERPATTILHRQSFTIIEAKHRRTLEKYGLEFKDLFAGRDRVFADLIDKYVNPGMAETFADVEERINTELNRLDQALTGLDPTLAENLTTRRRKILYHIGALRKKSHSAAIKKNETVKRQIDALFTALLPNKHLQERTLNVATFLNLHGQYFIDWVYDAIDLDDKGHRVIFL